MSKKAVILLSGGLDSTTILALAKSQGFEVHALSFRYGQRHLYELQSAAKVAAALGVKEHRVVDIDLRSFGGSALTSEEHVVPKARSHEEISTGIPITYVPARNTVFLSFALAWCDVLRCTDIFIGVNALDYSGYPDCRPEYIEAYEKMANLATQVGTEGTARIKIHAPLIRLSKAEIVKLGTSLSVDYSLTMTCYDPAKDGKSCGFCDACQLRQKGFAENGLTDPVPYADACV
jgi:7-cyano-7-deazaguanine synthase